MQMIYLFHTTFDEELMKRLHRVLGSGWGDRDRTALNPPPRVDNDNARGAEADGIERLDVGHAAA
ncbi:MAG: hypothetical protein AAF500_06390 [Myxococcota bacterium]